MKGLFSWFQIMRAVAVGHAPMESWPEDSYGLKDCVCVCAGSRRSYECPKLSGAEAIAEFR